MQFHVSLMKNIKNMFEHLGYFKEYWVNGKFIGCVNYCDKDRETIGYNGKQKETTIECITLANNRKIKANTEVETVLYVICGRLKK